MTRCLGFGRVLDKLDKSVLVVLLWSCLDVVGDCRCGYRVAGQGTDRGVFRGEARVSHFFGKRLITSHYQQ